MDELARQDDEMALTGEALRTVGSRRLPESSFALVPDPEKPSTWQICMVNEAGDFTKKSLGRATAHVTPGGSGESKVTITTQNLQKVKTRIRCAFRGLRIEESEIPHWVKGEAMNTRTPVAQLHVLEEKAFDPLKNEVVVTVIKPGLNLSGGKFYPPKVLIRDHTIFESAKMQKNHPTERERRERPEGSVDDYAAQLKEVWTESDGTVKGRAFVYDPGFREKLKNMAEGGILHEMGVSIRAIGSGVRGKINGKATTIIESLNKALSVDFVTFAGAGGMVEAFESDAMMETDIELIDEHTLREKRPDLVDLIETGNEAAETHEKENADMTEKVQELTDKLEASEKALKESETERDGLKSQVEESQRVEARAKTAVEITEAIAKAEDLPEPIREKLAQQFAEAETKDGIADAIEAERKCLKSLVDSKVVNMGESTPPEDDTDEKKGEAKLAEALAVGYMQKDGMTAEAAKAKAIVEAAKN